MATALSPTAAVPQAWHQQHGERWAPPPSSAASPKPARHYAKPNPAGRCDPHPSWGLIPQGDIDLLQQPAAGFEAADVCSDLRCELKDGRPPRDMRHDGDFGVQPERALRR